MMIPLTMRTESELTAMLSSARLELEMTIFAKSGMGMFRSREYYLAHWCGSADINNAWTRILELERELDSRTLSATI
jgi:hypothetical protein